MLEAKYEGCKAEQGEAEAPSFRDELEVPIDVSTLDENIL